MPRTTLIIDADPDPAIRNFHALGRAADAPMNKLIAKAKQGELAATRFGRAWRKAGLEAATAVQRIDTSYGGAFRRFRRGFSRVGFGFGGGLAGLGVIAENIAFSRVDAKIASITGQRLNTPTGRALSNERRRQLMSLALEPDIASSATDLARVQASLLEKGGRTLGNISLVRAIGRSSTAFETDPDDTTELVVRLVKGFGVEIKDATHAVEILAQAGKEGGFELRDMAKSIGPVFALARDSGASGPRGIANVGALFQVAALTAASPDEAATAVRRMIGSLGTKRTQKAIRSEGIALFNQDGTKRNPFDVLGDMVAKVASDPTGRIAQKFFERDPARILVTALAGRLSAEEAKTLNLKPGATRFDQFRQIATSALNGSTGLLEADLANFLASDAGKFDKALADLRTSVLDLGGAVSALATVLGFAAKNPKTAAALGVSAWAVGSAIPVALGTVAGGRMLAMMGAGGAAAAGGSGAGSLFGSAAAGAAGSAATTRGGLSVLLRLLGPLGLGVAGGYAIAKAIEANSSEQGTHLMDEPTLETGMQLSPPNASFGAQKVVFRVDPSVNVKITADETSTSVEDAVDMGP